MHVYIGSHIPYMQSYLRFQDDDDEDDDSLPKSEFNSDVLSAASSFSEHDESIIPKDGRVSISTVHLFCCFD